MTAAADIARVRWTEDPPRYIADPRVTLDTTLSDELGECGACAECFACAPKDGVHRITWVQGGVQYHVDVCGDPSCADYELKWLLRPRPEPGNPPRDVVFHVRPKLAEVLPSGRVWTPPGTGDQAFADIEACVEHLRNMRNTARQGEAWDAFEACRKLAIAAVAQIGIKRIADLERAA